MPAASHATIVISANPSEPDDGSKVPNHVSPEPEKPVDPPSSAHDADTPATPTSSMTTAPSVAAVSHPGCGSEHTCPVLAQYCTMLGAIVSAGGGGGGGEEGDGSTAGGGGGGASSSAGGSGVGSAGATGAAGGAAAGALGLGVPVVDAVGLTVGAATPGPSFEATDVTRSATRPPPTTIPTTRNMASRPTHHVGQPRVAPYPLVAAGVPRSPESTRARIASATPVESPGCIKRVRDARIRSSSSTKVILLPQT